LHSSRLSYFVKHLSAELLYKRNAVRLGCNCDALYAIISINMSNISLAGRRPTIRDVADLAEVGAGTVSRVLSGDARVRERTRGRVLAAVASLGYHLDERGRALRAKRGNLLLTIVPFFTRNLYMEILREIDRATPADTGTIMTVMNVESPEEKSRAFELAAWDSRLAGIIAVSLTPPEGFAEQLLPTVPTVLVDVQEGHFPSVVVDHIYGGYLARNTSSISVTSASAS
jgi:DNA-binding LacI/PurR family transcriptional regulator